MSKLSKHGPWRRFEIFWHRYDLPRRLLIKTEYCDGVSNAWYEDNSITVCYAYLDDIWRNVPKTVTPAGVAPIDALVGPMIDVFLHEAGHAVFDIPNIPILGREEDAADQFSNFIMLKADKVDARRLIQGNAYQYRGDVRRPVVVQSMKKFADVHGTPSQRYYNLSRLWRRSRSVPRFSRKWLPSSRSRRGL